MEQKQKVNVVKVFIQLLLVLVILPLLPMLIAWRWDWWEAWVFFALWILSFFISRALAARRNPGILAERATSLDHKNIQAWDNVLAPLVALGPALIPVVAGLDERFAWSNLFDLPWRLVGLALLVAGYAFSSWALIENSYFSGTVRLQSERGHHVISSGPYRMVRHPGYAGILLTSLGGPMLLNSTWAWVAALVCLIPLVVRTRLEDRFLQQELEGYREYAGRVRYRLVPGVW